MEYIPVFLDSWLMLLSKFVEVKQWLLSLVSDFLTNGTKHTLRPLVKDTYFELHVSSYKQGSCKHWICY